MSKLLFAGSRTDSVSVVGGVLFDDTSGLYIDTAYSDAGIDVHAGVMKIKFYDPAAAPLLSPYVVPAGHALYFHCFVGMNFNSFGYDGDCLFFCDSSGYQWVKLRYTGQFYYNSGTGTAPVWTPLGTNTYGMPGINRGSTSMDVKIVIDAGGNHTLFVAINSLTAVDTAPFSQPLMTELAYITIGPDSHNTECVWSQLLCTEDISTVGAHVQTSRAAAAGSYQQWVGTYTDVNEPATNYSTYNQALSADLKQTYDMGNITVPEGCVIQGVFHWLIAKNDGTTPANIQSVCIAGGSEFETADLNAFGIAYSGIGARYDSNPETSTAWTQSAWNAPVQLGFESKT